MKFFLSLIFTSVLFLGINPKLSSQNQDNNLPISFAVGTSYTIAPSYKIDGIWTVNTSTSANFYSLFADLVINKNLIGRVQLSSLVVSSLDEESASELESGFEMNGSLGYNYQLSSNSKISIPIMATIGYATVKEVSKRDAGMQLGGSLGLNYALTDRVSASSTLRYLKGVDFSDGAKIDQIDFSIGVMFRLL